ncbi:MAG: HAMP domain-containing histidine kinase [Alphaproteobacteria bacterium]|nr:MAG: HAMP domain-containing histidine kinase [Alphaproteobacteria bacterium]
MDMIRRPVAADAPGRPRARMGLSGKLLVLTLLFVMIAEVLIYVPSIANFRLNWLQDRLSAAYTAALVFGTAPSGEVPEPVARQILESIRAHAVALKFGQQRRLLAAGKMPGAVTHEIDMRDMPWHRAIIEAFDTLICTDADVMRVVGPAPMGGDFVEIVLDEAPLRKAMVDFSVRILILSLIISAITATLVYFALHRMLVRPMRRMTANMVAFRADPENPARIMAASQRSDEIGTAERELAAMQLDLATLLQQKNHLAALGLAVSKINHDLRNLLSSAQLFSERLAKISDPHVQRFAPKLMVALERAIAFCQSTLSYGRVQEAPPERRLISLELLVEDMRETLGLDATSRVRWVTAIERGVTVDADPDQLFRILLNLARNALQALETREPKDPGHDQIRVTGRREGAVVVIEVSDTGPGLSEKAREHLFEAFQGSTRTGSVGLGLAIVAELVRAHGGEVRLVEGTIGATFRVSIPDRAVDLDTRRERASA